MSLGMELSEGLATQLNGLIKTGKMLSAWNIARDLAPLHQWAGGESLRIAAYLASGLGNDRLGSALDWKNWRMDRGDPRRYFYALFPRMHWKSPAAFLPEIDRWLAQSDNWPHEQQADFFCIRASLLSSLRDFGPAHEAMGKALAVAPEYAWAHVAYSDVLEREDRYEEALSAAQAAVRLRPSYRPAVLQAVDCLVHLGRDDDAIELLRETHQGTENGAFVMRLQALYSEREDHINGLWCLEEAEKLMPLMTEPIRKWLAGRRADFLYLAGDFDGCLEWSDRKGEGFHQMVAASMRREGARSRQRRRLNVPFIRQHRMTCGPATLASLSRFWGRNHDHLEIAEAICYDGTHWHKERGWAEDHGFITREFRLTRESLIDVIDRGIPFTLTTSWITSGHLQACIGYDDRQESVLLRDPTHRHYGEVPLQSLIQEHPIEGPRCLIMIPEEESHRLDGVHLPDEALYNEQYELAKAIDRHDRWKAEIAVRTMQAIAPEHPLTWNAQARLSAYVGHLEKYVEWLGRLSGRFPDHAPLDYQRFHGLRRIGDYSEARQVLEKVLAKKHHDPVFVSEMGELLLQDARQHELAGHFLRRAARLRPMEGHSLSSLANWHAKSGDWSESMRMWRYASTLQRVNESFARSYFDSCRALKRTEEGLEYLRQRVRALGRQKSAPWLTLAGALDDLQRDAEAREILEKAIRDLSDDGELRLEAAGFMIKWGEPHRTRGLQWLEEARGKVSENAWLRRHAYCMSFLGERQPSIRSWQSLVAMEPLALDANRSLAYLLAEEYGVEEAASFLEKVTRKYPRHSGLLALQCEWLRSSGYEKQIPVLDRILEIDPEDGDALRQRAVARFHTGNREGGFCDARESCALQPRNPEAHDVLADLLQRDGQVDEAMECARRAISLNVDYTGASEKLLQWARGPKESEEAIAFLLGEMRRQVSHGECVPTYQALAWSVLPPPKLLAELTEFCQERPDLWQTWSARIDQALRMDLTVEAKQCAHELEQRFPVLPRTWIEIAKVHHALGALDEEVSSFQKSVDLSPAWDWAARQLAAALERLERYDEAQSVLERAMLHEPLNAANYGMLADLLYKCGKKGEAFELLLDALTRCPYYSWGWTSLAHWGTELGRTEETISAVRMGCEKNGHNANFWYLASEVWGVLGRHDDALQAIESGLKISPEHGGLLDQRATLLCSLSRFEDALAACEPGQDQKPVGRAREGRKAWILMEMGQGPAAISAMKNLLEREPDYEWGWQQLAMWHYDRRDWPQMQVAAKQWLRLCPNVAVAHGYAGLASKELGEKDVSRRSYERAYLLDPEYSFAGRELLELQIDQSDFSGADRTLATLRHYSPSPAVECDALRLQFQRGDKEGAFLIAEGLFCSCMNASPLQWIGGFFGNHHQGVAWLNRMERLIQSGKAASEAAMYAWASIYRGTQLPTAARKLRKFRITEELRNAAWAALLDTVIEERNQDLFLNWLRWNRKRFHSIPQLWNEVGRGMIHFGMLRKAPKWFRGWETREGVGSHTLVNLSVALDAVQSLDDGAVVREEGIKRFRDKVSQYLRANHGCYLAIQGKFDEASKVIEPVEEALITKYYAGMAAFARSLIAAQAGDEEKARVQYKLALENVSVTDRGTKKYVRAVQKTLAQLLPWSKGRAGRVVKQWGTIAGVGGRAWSVIAWILGALVILVALIFAVAIGASSPGLALMILIGVIFGVRSLRQNS